MKMMSILFPFVFVGMWCFVIYIFSRMSGWSNLAKQFRLRKGFVGKRRHFQSGMIGLVNYRSCLTLGANQEGIYFSMLPIFAIGCPPLLIPWHEIKEVKKEKIFFWNFATLSIGSPSVTMKFHWSMLDFFRPWINESVTKFEM
jgi:hypothetical protein